MFKCQNCNKEFKTQNALNAHNKKCNFNKTYHFIYKTTNLLNNMYYIGMHSTNNIDDGYLGSGTRLCRAIRKYGKDNFRREILEYLPDRNSLALRESEIVTSELIIDDLCMNLKPGGRGGLCNEEHRNNFIKISHEKFLNKLKDNKIFKYNFSIICSIRSKLLWQNEDFINKMKSNSICYGNYWKGRKRRIETIKKTKETFRKINHQQGSKNSCYGTCWIMKDGISKKIKKEELDLYIKNGWIKGRKCNNSKGLKEFYKNKENSFLHNKKCIFKDNVEKYICKDDIESYINKGWVLGHKPRLKKG